MSTHVTATERAVSLLRDLKDCFGPLILYQGGGCSSGNQPICARRGGIRMGTDDILLDVEDGGTDSLSLENREEVHFVAGSFYLFGHQCQD